VAKKPKGPRRANSVSTKALIAILSIFAVAVLAVSAIAVKGAPGKEGDGFPTIAGGHSPTPTVEDSSDPAEAPSQEPSQEPSESPTSEEPAAPAEIELIPPKRILATVSSDLIIRATVASCDSNTKFEISKDGGASWNASAAIESTGATKALRIIPTRAELIQLVSLNADCEPQLVRTENQGTSWLAPIGATGAWYLDPAQPTSLGGPDGRLDIACEAVNLAAIADRAAVLCSDATIITSTDRGVSWSEPVDAPNVTSIGLSDDSYIVSLGNADECVGVQAASFNGTKIGTPGACLERTVKSGDTAIAQTGDSVFAWSGKDFSTSIDGGKTWQ